MLSKKLNPENCILVYPFRKMHGALLYLCGNSFPACLVCGNITLINEGKFDGEIVSSLIFSCPIFIHQNEHARLVQLLEVFFPMR